MAELCSAPKVAASEGRQQTVSSGEYDPRKKKKTKKNKRLGNQQASQAGIEKQSPVF